MRYKEAEGFNQPEGFFPITFLHRDDLKAIFHGDEEIIRKIDAISDDDMRILARKMEDDYMTQLFSRSLKILSEEFIGE